MEVEGGEAFQKKIDREVLGPEAQGVTWWAHRDTQSVFLNPVQTHAGGTCGKNVLLIHHFDHHFDLHLGPIAITKTPRPIIIGSAIKCNDPGPSLVLPTCHLT